MLDIIVLWALNMFLFCFSPVLCVVFFYPESQVHMGGKTYDIDCISLAEAPDDWTLIQVQCSLNAPGWSVSKSNYRLVESYPLPYSMCMGKYIYTRIYIYIYDVYLLMCMGHISIYVNIYIQILPTFGLDLWVNLVKYSSLMELFWDVQHEATGLEGSGTWRWNRRWFTLIYYHHLSHIIHGTGVFAYMKTRNINHSCR